MSIKPRAVRGRPLLSQAKIVDKALALLQKIPLKEVTMRRLAQELDTTPAALYAYIKNQQDLFNAVTERVISGIDLRDLDHETDWREMLRKWARAVRERQLQFPHVTTIVQVNPHTPVAWFEITEPQLRALQMAGLSGYALMDTSRCFSRVVLGSILNEIMLEATMIRLEREDADAALEHLSPRGRAAIENLLPYLGDQDNDALFEFTINCVIRGIESALSSEH